MLLIDSGSVTTSTDVSSNAEPPIVTTLDITTVSRSFDLANAEAPISVNPFRETFSNAEPLNCPLGNTVVGFPSASTIFKSSSRLRSNSVRYFRLDSVVKSSGVTVLESTVKVSTSTLSTPAFSITFARLSAPIASPPLTVAVMLISSAFSPMTG